MIVPPVQFKTFALRVALTTKFPANVPVVAWKVVRPVKAPEVARTRATVTKPAVKVFRFVLMATETKFERAVFAPVPGVLAAQTAFPAERVKIVPFAEAVAGKL